MLYIHTVRDDKGKIRLRALPGQKHTSPSKKNVDSNKNIQGPRSIRDEKNLGTVFEVTGLVDRESHYSIVGWPKVAKDYSMIPKVKKRGRPKLSKKESQINILEFV